MVRHPGGPQSQGDAELGRPTGALDEVQRWPGELDPVACSTAHLLTLGRLHLDAPRLRGRDSRQPKRQYPLFELRFDARWVHFVWKMKLAKEPGQLVLAKDELT